ncbi:MAG: hypothetical protein IJ100_04510 [Lachnospiraceae bacterium]|nr:hypothetical protein [Lachnospiraceae bacterium]
MVKADNDQLYPGDEVKLKFGDFPVVITRRNLMLNKRHFDSWYTASQAMNANATK